MKVVPFAPWGHGGKTVEVVLLSRREKQILLGLCRGYSTKEISSLVFAKLRLNPRTIDQRVKMMCRALGLGSRRQLIVWGMAHPQCWLPDTYVEKHMHPSGCHCRALYCTAMRMAEPAVEELAS